MVPVDNLLSLLPADLLEQLALEYKVDAKNQIRLTGSTVFICLLDGLLNQGDITLRVLEEIFHSRTGRRSDHSSFGKRLATIKPEFYTHLHEQLAAKATPGEIKALRLRWVDATAVTLSAKLLAFGITSGTCRGNASQRSVKSILELQQDGLPHLLHLCTEQSEANDNVALGQVMRQQSQPGDLWVFDRGVHGRDRLLGIAQAGAFFLTPQCGQSVQVTKALWQAETAVPTAAPVGSEPALVLVRAESAVFGSSLEKLPSKQVSKKPPSQQSSQQFSKWRQMPLVLVHCLRYDTRARHWKPLVLMTNLPASADGLGAGPYSWLQLAELYRRRWDIETLFKFLKQHLGYSHLTSRTENGIRVMIYMSLIAALLLIWYKRLSGIDRGWRSVKYWFAHDVHEWTRLVLQQAIEQAFLPNNPSKTNTQPDTG
jgi:Transposase DDE domain